MEDKQSNYVKNKITDIVRIKILDLSHKFLQVPQFQFPGRKPFRKLNCIRYFLYKN